MSSKVKVTKQAIKDCKSLHEVRRLLRYTKADFALMAGKKYGRLLDRKTILDALAIFAIEKELLDGELEEHLFD